MPDSDPNFNPNEFIFEGISDALSGINPIGSFDKILKITLVADDLAAIYSNDKFPDGLKNALAYAILLDAVGGGTLPADIPVLFEAMWDTVNNNATTGEPLIDYYESLNHNFGDDIFPLNPDGTIGWLNFLPISENTPEGETQDIGDLVDRTLDDQNEDIPSKPLVDPNDSSTPNITPVSDDQNEDRSQPPAGKGGWLPSYWFGSPLVLDLDGQGIDLASLSSSEAVYWDIDEDGFAEASGWIKGNDGLLAIDLNNDGVIGDHSELFGSTTTDGFSSLTAYDTNLDNLINTNDTQFGDLLVWVDANNNGYSESEELSSLVDLGITEINLNASLVNYDIEGNNITHESTFTINGQTQTIVDAWFAYDNANTVYVESYSLDARAFQLPTLRGYGNIADLFIAMSQDETLLNMVKDVAFSDTITVFSTEFDLNQKMEDILYRWAGVQDVVVNSRGAHIDARQLEFMEKYFGEDYLQFGTQPNPGQNAAYALKEVFTEIEQTFLNHLLIQTDANILYEANAEYNILTGRIENSGLNRINIVDELETSITSTADGEAHIFNQSNGVVTLYEAGGDDAIWLSGVNLSELRLVHDASNYNALNILYGDTTIKISEQFRSLETSNNYYDNKIVEKIVLDDGTVIDLLNNLTFTGTENADYLNGLKYGDDILVGGLGNDNLQGKDGNDTYVWSVGDGNDTIVETSGTDQLVLQNVIESELRFEKFNTYNLKIHINSEEIVIQGQFQSDAQNNSYYDYLQVETLLLDDGTVINLTEGLTFKGTNMSDSLQGLRGNDTLIGLEGNDYIYAQDGDDTLIGGLGNDNLRGANGNDTYVWSVGDGNDTIVETSGIDQLVLHNVLQSELRFEKSNTYNLKIHINSEEIVLQSQFQSDVQNNNYYDYLQVETLLLDDGTVIDLMNDITFSGTAGNDVVFGLSNSDSSLIGLEGSDYLYANNGNDTLDGGDGTDFLYAGAGNDILKGGDGIDMLYGQNGSDVFLFEALTAFNFSDNIQDFKLSQNDKFDVSDLLQGYDAVTDAITDFVQITESGSNSYLSVDADGGGDNFVQIAYIYNETGLTDEDALETSGNLITV
tara:strand:- start:4017 stop:7256 length:3240 start_codon:yes stop_codon:yes gene_type:complete